MHKELVKELLGPKYRTSPTNGKVEVETKDDMRKRGIPSPNLADAFNLTFYADYAWIQRKQDAKKKRRHFKRRSSGDPTSWRLA